MILLTILTILLEALLALMVAYLLLLTLGALFGRRTTPRTGQPQTRFAILVPAHNEERLLPELLASLRAQAYPSNLLRVFVVADNCTDRTAEIARQGGATAFERQNQLQVGKGYALNWLLEQITAAVGQDAFDAFVIFDADTIADAHFLEVMDAHLHAGENAIQGYYAVRDPGQSWGVALRYAALAVLHYLRPLGRGRFGGSAGLKGNGMCFRASLYRWKPWSGSVTEDIEYHMALLLEGQRVNFAPDARLEAEMPGTLKSSTTQNVRWESGRLQAARVYVPRLLARLAKGQPFLYLDAVMEHLIPPTAMVILGVAVCLLLGGLVGWLGGGWTLLQVGLGLLVGLALYIACGLAMVKAPAKVWLSLLYAPFYALWKMVLLVKMILGRQKQGWVRTQR